VVINKKRKQDGREFSEDGSASAGRAAASTGSSWDGAICFFVSCEVKSFSFFDRLLSSLSLFVSLVVVVDDDDVR